MTSPIKRDNPVDPSLPTSGSGFDPLTFPSFPRHPSGDSSLYLLGNEHGTSEAIERLMEAPLIPNGMHIGFSAWANLSIIAARKSTFGVIGDINSLTLDTMDRVKQLIRNASTKEEFIHHFRELLQEIKSQLARGYLEAAKLEEELKNPSSWIFSDESYNHIRSLYASGRIVHVQLNILDEEALLKIRDWGLRNGLKIDTLYTSNIREWIRQDESGSFDKSKKLDSLLNALMDKSTFFIDAKRETLMAGSPIQRVKKGEVPNIRYEKTKRKFESDGEPSSRIQFRPSRLFKNNENTDR